MADHDVRTEVPTLRPASTLTSDGAVDEAADSPSVEAEAEPAKRLPPLWRNRDFMLLWSGQAVSAVGNTMSWVVFPLLILALTDSPGAAGIAGALFSIPYLLFSLPVGALIDRWDRKKVMVLCEAGRAINMASVPVAWYLGSLTVWQLYVVALVEGTLFVFFNIAEVAALPRVVEKAQLPQAAAQNEVAHSAAMLAGPPLGGVLFQSVGWAFPFILDAVSYGVSMVSLLFIKTRFQQERAPAERHLRAEIVEGLRWLWRQPLIRFMSFVTGGNNFMYAGGALILIVLAKELGADEASIGTMFSIAAVGGILGAALGGQIQKRFSFGQVIVSVMVIQALIFPFLAVAPNIFALGALLGAMYLLGPIYNVVRFSYRLALIPDELQGRVNSTFRLIAFGGQPAGAFLAGQLLERVGGTGTVYVIAVGVAVLALLVVLNPYVRNAKPIAEAQAA